MAQLRRGNLSFVEDQAIKIVGQVEEGSLACALARPMVRMNRPYRFFWWAETCSTFGPQLAADLDRPARIDILLVRLVLGLPGQICRADLPSLTAVFSFSVLRCLGAEPVSHRRSVNLLRKVESSLERRTRCRSNDGLRRSLRTRRCGWRRPAGARSARWRRIWALACRRVRWISRSRDRLAAMSGAAPQADIAAELKRLRRENEILRQECDILKRATAFFAREGSRSSSSSSIRRRRISPYTTYARYSASARAATSSGRTAPPASDSRTT